MIVPEHSSHVFCILIIQINFDLSRSDKWESLFPYGTQRTDGGEVSSSPIGDDRRESMMEKKRERLASSSGSAAVLEVVDSDSAVSRTFENPPSWVSPILLDRTQYVIRYPPCGRRTVQYYCAKADFFARNIHPQVDTLHILFLTTFPPLLLPFLPLFPPSYPCYQGYIVIIFDGLLLGDSQHEIYHLLIILLLKYSAVHGDADSIISRQGSHHREGNPRVV